MVVREGGGEGSRGESGWVYMPRKFSAPPGAQVLDLNRGDLRGVTDLGLVFFCARLAQSRSSRSRGSGGPGSRPVQLVGLQGARKCQGLASSSSTLSFLPSRL